MGKLLNFNAITQAPVAIAYVDRNLNYIAHSAKWCKDYNLEETDLKGKNHYDIFPEISQEWRDINQRVLKTGIAESNPAQLFVRQDGSEQWLKWTVAPIIGDNKEIIGLIYSTEDITEMMSYKNKIARDHQLLVDATNRANIGSWEFDHRTNELYWSTVTRQLHEVEESYVPSVETGINFYKEGESRETVTKLFNKSYQNGKSYEAELKIITAKGNERWVRSVLKAEMENGTCVRQYGTFEDITDKVEADLAYKLALRKFQDVFEASGVGMFVLDPIDLKITKANPKICELLELETDQVKQHSLEKLVSKSDLVKFFDGIWDLLNKKIDHLEVNLKLKRSSGRLVSCSIIGSLIEDNFGNPVDLVIQAIDLTEIKRKEKELRSFTKYIEQQNERLLNFAHIVSHNLRSHSSNFEVLLHLYDQETTAEDKNNIIKLLKSSSKQLSDTIGHLNDVVAVNSNKIDLIKVSLKESVKRVMDNISAQIRENDIQVNIDITDDFIVAASPAYLESILLNLLTNSIKYRQPDIPTKINIHAFKHKGRSKIIFQDNGKGIDMKVNGHKIFGMYKTFHGNKDARGIGLYITKNQIEAMGGTIKVHSETNIGTQFKITL